MAKLTFQVRQNLLAMINNSIGTQAYNDVFAVEDDNTEVKNITERGNLSCAYFVSCVLVIFKLIKEVHLTVDGTLRDMEQSGWRKLDLDTEAMQAGDIIIWKDEKPHRHIGFKNWSKAVSTSPEKRKVISHREQYRPIQEVWRYNFE